RSAARKSVHCGRCRSRPVFIRPAMRGAAGAHRGTAVCQVEGDRLSREPQAAPIAIIADDEDLGRLLLAESAAECGLEPLVYDNGTGALEAALSRDVAIVLLD